MSPMQSAAWFTSLGAFSLAIASVFALHGAWMVLPFAIVEIVGLLVAFFWFGRHAADYERIEAGEGKLVVETSVGPSISRCEKISPWFRVEYDGGPRELITVLAGREELQIGRFVSCDRRIKLAREIRLALNGAVS